MEFIGFTKFVALLEAKKRNLEYGCVMLYPTIIKNWNSHLSIIDNEDLYDKEGYGLEKEPHVTVLYGLHIDETDPNIIKDVLKLFNPISVEINRISIFENEEYDVVKYEVPVIPELKQYHETIKSLFPYTSSYDKYSPHITIAYVNPGTGKKYVGKVKKFKIDFDKAVYSYKKPKESKYTKIYVNL